MIVFTESEIASHHIKKHSSGSFKNRQAFYFLPVSKKELPRY
jgi:hypothetical protein